MPKPHPDGVQHDDAGGGAPGGRGQVIHVATRCSFGRRVRRAVRGLRLGGIADAAGSQPATRSARRGGSSSCCAIRRWRCAGRCRVTEAKPAPPPRNPTSASPRFMLRVSLTDMDEASREVHRRLIALRSAPVPLPIPPEPSETTQIESARGGSAGTGSGPADSCAAAGAAAAGQAQSDDDRRRSEGAHPGRLRAASRSRSGSRSRARSHRRRQPCPGSRSRHGACARRACRARRTRCRPTRCRS